MQQEEYTREVEEREEAKAGVRGWGLGFETISLQEIHSLWAVCPDP
jgi:hypothetical protein